jgi:hypothetical protein
MYVECDAAAHVSTNFGCANQSIALGFSQFARGAWVAQQPSAGLGLAALRDFSPGDTVCAYTGAITRRHISQYLLQVRTSEDRKYMLDGEFCGSIGRFANHSVESANCDLQIWCVGHARMHVLTNV